MYNHYCESRHDSSIVIELRCNIVAMKRIEVYNECLLKFFQLSWKLKLMHPNTRTHARTRTRTQMFEEET